MWDGLESQTGQTGERREWLAAKAPGAPPVAALHYLADPAAGSRPATGGRAGTGLSREGEGSAEEGGGRFLVARVAAGASARAALAKWQLEGLGMRPQLALLRAEAPATVSIAFRAAGAAGAAGAALGEHSRTCDRIAVGYEDGVVELWRIAAARAPPSRGVLARRGSTAGADGGGPGALEVDCALAGLAGAAQALRASPCGARLLALSRAGDLAEWCAASGAKLRTLAAGFPVLHADYVGGDMSLVVADRNAELQRIAPAPPLAAPDAGAEGGATDVLSVAEASVTEGLWSHLVTEGETAGKEEPAAAASPVSPGARVRAALARRRAEGGGAGSPGASPQPRPVSPNGAEAQSAPKTEAPPQPPPPTGSAAAAAAAAARAKKAAAAAAAAAEEAAAEDEEGGLSPRGQREKRRREDAEGSDYAMEMASRLGLDIWRSIRDRAFSEGYLGSTDFLGAHAPAGVVDTSFQPRAADLRELPLRPVVLFARRGGVMVKKLADPLASRALVHVGSAQWAANRAWAAPGGARVLSEALLGGTERDVSSGGDVASEPRTEAAPTGTDAASHEEASSRGPDSAAVSPARRPGDDRPASSQQTAASRSAAAGTARGPPSDAFEVWIQTSNDDGSDSVVSNGTGLAAPGSGASRLDSGAAGARGTQLLIPRATVEAAAARVRGAEHNTARAREHRALPVWARAAVCPPAFVLAQAAGEAPRAAPPAPQEWEEFFVDVEGPDPGRAVQPWVSSDVKLALSKQGLQAQGLSTLAEEWDAPPVVAMLSRLRVSETRHRRPRPRSGAARVQDPRPPLDASTPLPEVTPRHPRPPPTRARPAGGWHGASDVWFAGRRTRARSTSSGRRRCSTRSSRPTRAAAGPPPRRAPRAAAPPRCPSSAAAAGRSGSSRPFPSPPSSRPARPDALSENRGGPLPCRARRAHAGGVAGSRRSCLGSSAASRWRPRGPRWRCRSGARTSPLPCSASA